MSDRGVQRNGILKPKHSVLQPKAMHTSARYSQPGPMDVLKRPI